MSENVVEVRHLGIYSSRASPKENYAAGRRHGFSPLEIIRQATEAANLSEALARKYRKEGETTIAEAFANAEKAFRAFQKYASEEYSR